MARGWEPVYRVVKRIPAGCVATYGQVAALAGMPRAARQVGWALNALQAEDDVPWHRVINAQGQISRRGEREIEDLQRSLLEAEGVAFTRTGRVDLESHGWTARARSTKAGGETRNRKASTSSNKKTRTGTTPKAKTAVRKEAKTGTGACQK